MKRSLTGTLVMRAILFAITITFSLPALAPAQQSASYMPNPKLTPGATLKVNKDDLCSRTKTLPDSIPISLKGKVFDLYGIRTDKSAPHNIDHLIPVSLGGSNLIANLWPQPLSGEWSYYHKNILEHRLRKLVCRGELDLEKAQQEISTDWVSAYKKYVGGGGGKRSKR